MSDILPAVALGVSVFFLVTAIIDAVIRFHG
jgi:hypothetical protein